MPVEGEIIDQPPPSSATITESGFAATMRWSVIARSEWAAWQLLKAKRGVGRGCAYKTPQGEVVPNVTCTDLEIEGRPHAPAVAGGVGQYLITGRFAESPGGGMGVQQAAPGKPVVWSPRASLATAPVDIDIFGAEILTSSLEPLDPPLSAPQPLEILHGEFYVQAPDAITAYKPFRKFIGALNRLPLPKLGIAEPFCLLCHPFTSEPSDTGWIKMTCDFEYRPPKVIDGKTYGGWLDVWRDRGTRKLVDPGNADPSKRFAWLTDSTGARINSPVPFKNGQPTTTNFAVPGAPKGAVMVTYNYHAKDFSKIPFPTGSL